MKTTTIQQQKLRSWRCEMINGAHVKMNKGKFTRTFFLFDDGATWEEHNDE